ncbi:hypothetical protein FKM82_008778 [Ascaphus truei]
MGKKKSKLTLRCQKFFLVTYILLYSPRQKLKQEMLGETIHWAADRSEMVGKLTYKSIAVFLRSHYRSALLRHQRCHNLMNKCY